VEALVNEVILDVIDPPPGGPSTRVAGIPATASAQFEKLWRGERNIKGGPVGKYQATLDAVSKPRYDEVRDPFKSARSLFDLRNHFVHYKPEWQDVDVAHDFELALKKARVAENPQPIGAPWFPNKALGAGLAEWACHVSARFAKSLVEADGPRRDL